MRFIGVDPSLTSTGFAAYDVQSGIVAFRTISTKRTRPIFERQSMICAELIHSLRPYDVLVFEDFAISARFAPSGRFTERIEICGMLKYIVPKVTKLPWLTCPPNVLKMFIANKASAKKEEVVAAVTALGFQVKNNDEADALSLALLAATYYNAWDMPLTQKQLKAVQKFKLFGDNAKYLEEISASLQSISN